jgi:hypothetical protein
LKDGNDEERTRIKRNIVTKKQQKSGEKKEHCTSQDTKISIKYNYKRIKLINCGKKGKAIPVTGCQGP